MAMTMVQVGVVAMGVSDLFVSMRMAVWFTGRVSRIVDVLVVCVVRVQVVVLQRLVPMLMLVPFSQMQPDARGHKDSSHEQADGRLVVEEHHGNTGPDKRCEREVGARPRHSEMAKSQDEKVRLSP